MRPPLDRKSDTKPRPKGAWDPFDDSPDEDEDNHPAMTYQRPRGLAAARGGLLAVVVIFGLTGSYAAYWFAAAFWFRASVIDWMVTEGTKGNRAGAGDIIISGFPFELRLRVPDPIYEHANNAGGRDRWQATRLTLTAKPWWPGRVTADLKGAHVLTRIDGDGGATTWQGTADRLLITWNGDGGFAGAGDVSARGLRLSDGAGADVFALGSGRVHYRGHDTAPKVDGGRGPLIETSLRLEGLRLPPAWATPLGRDVAGVEGGVGLTGSLVSGDLMAMLTAWRDGGGTLEISNLGLRYGPVTLGANGTMALDGNLQPIGAFTVRAEGFFELVDALWRKGVVAGRDAVTAKVVLGAFAKKREGDARPSISLPITVQGQKLYAGPVPLMAVPSVEWPDDTPPAEQETLPADKTE